jgi:hypothetical protein
VFVVNENLSKWLGVSRLREAEGYCSTLDSSRSDLGSTCYELRKHLFLRETITQVPKCVSKSIKLKDVSNVAKNGVDLACLLWIKIDKVAAIKW